MNNRFDSIRSTNTSSAGKERWVPRGRGISQAVDGNLSREGWGVVTTTCDGLSREGWGRIGTNSEDTNQKESFRKSEPRDQQEVPQHRRELSHKSEPKQEEEEEENPFPKKTTHIGRGSGNRGGNRGRGYQQLPQPCRDLTHKNEPKQKEGEITAGHMSDAHLGKKLKPNPKKTTHIGRGSGNRGGNRGAAPNRGRGYQQHTDNHQSHDTRLPTASEARRFLNELSRNKPHCESCDRIIEHVFGRHYGLAVLRKIINNPEPEQESQLLWLFSQPLFGGLIPQSELNRRYNGKTITAASELLKEYYGSIAFSPKHIAIIGFRAKPEDMLRCILVFSGIRPDHPSIATRYSDRDSLEDIDKFVKQVHDYLNNVTSPEHYSIFVSQSDSDIDPRNVLLKETSLLIKSLARELLQPQAKHKPGSDVKESDSVGRGQNVNFETSYQFTTVEPTLTELKNPQDTSRARCITLGSPITSFDHHLDNVFHTTRYDALQPLRDGIQQLLKADFCPRKVDGQLQVNVLLDLRVVDIDASQDFGPVFVFYSKTLHEMGKRNKSVGKRRLLPGSMVVITHDQLVTGEVCTAVRLRDFPIESGYVCVRRAELSGTLQAETGNTNNAALGPLKNLHATYTIIESKVYWETHVHSLKALQTLDTTDPLFSHIRCLPGPCQPLQGKSYNDLDPTRVASFTFDNTQAAAFQHVFTSAAPIVQGPPGTGKSYIGVCAVRTMLHENIHSESPILIVCYTNHALDSFLEDLIHHESDLFSGEEGTRSLIRLGYQSKSPTLQNYFLKSGQVKASRFYASRQALLSCWEDANKDNFVPAADDTVNSEQVHNFFRLLQCSKQQKLKEATSNLECAQKECKAAKMCISTEAVSVIKQAFITVPSLRKVSNENAIRVFQTHSHDNAIVRIALQHLQRFPDALMVAQGKLTQRQIDAQEWLKDATEVHERSQKELLMFMTIWRDAKGRRRQQVALTDVEPQTEDEEMQEDDDMDEENHDRFLEQPVEQNEEDYQRRVPRHEEGIQLVAVDRPAFLDTELKIDFNNLAADQRHALHDYLKDRRIRSSLPQMARCIQSTGQEANTYRSALNQAGKHILKKAKVIGATTSGLARHLLTLSSIDVRCVILEEAAEIPECHALAAIIPGVRHFIQVGDHQQLRPKISCYDNHNRHFDISLMERMLRINNECKTLATQRRMRPAIADFIRPLYEEKLLAVNATLTDHTCVNTYPQNPIVYGLAPEFGFVQYVEHHFPESVFHIGASKQNCKEAEFAVALAWYLTKQRPMASITILVPYTGQVLYAQSVARSSAFKSILDAKNDAEQRLVRIVSIDDFQGEESDVVILCLTRSNKPGFLQEKNRICVALSRARHLQFVVGNFKCFEESKTYWPTILDRARNLPGGIRPSITLQCMKHGQMREFSVADKYSHVMSSLGGCDSLCGSKRSCGHTCETRCHGQVECDLISECTQPCAKVGPACGSDRTCDHPCVNECCEPCGECKVTVEVVCGCGNPFGLECYLQRPSGSYYPQCTRPHYQVPLRCGHIGVASCYKYHMEHELIVCNQKCGGEHNDCSHPCEDECANCYDRRKDVWQHMPCKNKCTRPLACGHACESPCSNICPPCVKECEYRCDHHKQCFKNHKCGDVEKCHECTMPCTNRCKHSECTKRCGELCDRKQCDERCTELLKCGHQCRGLCGERCLSRCLFCNPETIADDLDFFSMDYDKDDALFIQLDCGDMFEVNAFDYYIAERTNFDEINVGPPRCPKCHQIILFDSIKRYKSTLNKARRTIQAVKGKVVDLQKNLLTCLAVAENQLDKLLDTCKTIPERFVNVPALIDAIASADQLRERIVKASNLQLTVGLCHKVLLLDLIYTVTAKGEDYPGSTTDGRAGNLRMNKGIKKLQDMPSNASKNTMTKVVLDTIVGVVKDRNADRTLNTHAEQLHSVSQFEDVDEREDIDQDLIDVAAILVQSRPRGLSQDEKDAIVNALASTGDVKRFGAFRTCPCGYIYAIGNCGGAMEESTCPDCGKMIGGTQHRDIDGVRHNGDIDGSTAPAWPQPQAYP